MDTEKEDLLDLFEEIRPKRLSDEVYEQIKSLFFKGKLQPGDKLPSERRLAEAFNVGRPCVREALNRLSAVGLIEARKKDGYYVRSLTEGLMGPLKEFIENELKNLIDFMEVRKMLDIWCAKQAIKNGTEEDFRKIHDALLSEGGGSNFHIAVAEASHNIILYHVICNMHNLLSTITFIKKRRRENPELYARDHQKIYEALLHRDEKALESAITLHIDQFIEDAKRDNVA